MEALLKQLCRIDAVAGYEEELRLFLAEQARPFADEMYTDPLGNLLLFKKGSLRRKRPCLVSAHMDEVGLLVNDYEKTGEMVFSPVGPVDPKALIAKKLSVGAEKRFGVVALKAIHMTTPAERKIVPGYDKLRLDVGALNEDDAKQLVKVGTPAAFRSPLTAFGQGLVYGKALDSRVPCAVMLSLLQNDLAYDTWFAFTACSKIGHRGAGILSRRLDPGLSITLTGTSAADLPEVEDYLAGTHVGKGAAIVMMDKGTIYEQDLYRPLAEQATERKISWQYKKVYSETTDASAIHHGASGAKCLALAVPVRNIDTAVATVALSDVESLYQLAQLSLERSGVGNV